MWDVFALTVLAEIILLYLPSAVLLRGLKLSWLMSLVCAPIVSISVYSCMGIIYDKANIASSWQTMFLPLLIIAVLIVLLSRAVSRSAVTEKRECFFLSDIKKRSWLILLLYVVISSTVTFFYFILPLNGPGSFNQGPDNAAHLSLIQSFLDSGNYSSLNSSYYHDIKNIYQDPTGGNGSGGFYPAAWHCAAALAGSFTGAGAAVSANASLFVFIAIVFPLSVFGFVGTICKNKYLVVLSGAFVALGFGAFPWGILYFGPLYPNFAAFAVIPSCMALFVAAFSRNTAKSRSAIMLLIFAVSLLGLALLQTNAVFTLGVFLIPFCIGLIWRKVGSLKSRFVHYRTAQVFAVFAFLIMCGLVWLIAYNLPIMSGIVSYPWAPFTSLRQEIVNILLLSYRDSAAQPVMGVLVLAGIIYLLKKRTNRWLICTYAITCFMCIVAAVSSGEIRSFLIGFWYTDSYRIAAMAALAAIPLASYGLYATICLIIKVWDKVTDWFSENKTHFRFQYLSVSLVMLALLYYPSFVVPGVGSVATALGEFENSWFNTNNNIGSCVLDHDEQEFLTEVKQVVGDELVINKPDDGSVFAYGGNNIDVFYKRTGIEAYLTDSGESQLFRNNLDEYATNEDVQEAVKKTGAKYLLLLDADVNDKAQTRYWFDHYYKELWQGMDAITEETPGFKVVLAEGDMRLYEIEPVG